MSPDEAEKALVAMAAIVRGLMEKFDGDPLIRVRLADKTTLVCGIEVVEEDE